MQAAAAMRDVREAVASLRGRVAETLARAEELLARQKCDLEARVAFGGFTSPKLLSEDIVIDGARVDRLRIRRVEVGAPVSRSFGAAIGVTRCVTRALDVREFWEGLLAREAQSGDLLYESCATSRTGCSIAPRRWRPSPQSLPMPCSCSLRHCDRFSVGQRRGLARLLDPHDRWLAAQWFGMSSSCRRCSKEHTGRWPAASRARIKMPPPGSIASRR